MTNALAKRPTAMKSEALAKYLQAGMFRAFRELEPFMRELWARFAALKRNERIAGCATKEQYCERVLHRTPRAVRYMLAGGNPRNAKRKPAEIIAPSRPALPAATMEIPYVEDFLSEEEADTLFAMCQSLPHEREKLHYGNSYRSVTYPAYGLPNQGDSADTMIPMKDAPPEIKALAKKLSDYTGKDINRLGVGGYENANDGMNFHQHKRDTSDDQSVYVISLGATREIRVRPIGVTDKSQYLSLWPVHGSLLRASPRVQHNP